MQMKKIIWNENKQPMAPCVATIGFFDGVHRGHQYLIRHVIEEARADGLESTVITFDRHPRQVLQSDYIPDLLTTPDSKMLLLSKTEVDNTVMLHFDKELAALSAHDFMEKVLRDQLNVRKLVIGYDNRFGHERTEGFDDYVRYGRELGIEVIHNQAFVLQGVNVSSSVIRRYLQAGEVEMANVCLGYPYTIAGHVTTGYKMGHELGFPTANLDTAGYGQLVPAGGVYAVRVRLQTAVTFHQGMMNIGTRPTFDGKELSLETNIFDFDEDIYGQVILVAFAHRIRAERKFDSPEALVAQLKEDRQMVEEQFKKEKENE
jgi:riboflavin kinase/FMN adenylyltransferase